MSALKSQKHSAIVGPDGARTHVIVPADEYDRMRNASRQPSEDAIERAAAALNNPNSVWHDANDVLADILRDGLKRARKSTGLTQAQLGRRVGLTQPQLSRLEKDSDKMTLKLVRKVAAALSKGSGRRPGRKPSRSKA